MHNGIFLAHINEDKPKVRILRDRLQAEGFRTWMDENDIFAGEDWERKIEKTIANAGLVLICLSKLARDKQGVFQKERKLAEEAQLRMPPDGIFMIPIILEAEAEGEYEKLQSVRFGQEGDLQKLFTSIRSKTSSEQKEKIFLAKDNNYDYHQKNLMMTDDHSMSSPHDANTHTLSIRLEEAEERKAVLEAEGKDTDAISQEIVRIKRQLREEGGLIAGDILSGRYKLIEIIGTGGFGEVWKSFDRRLNNEIVAVKVLHSQHRNDKSKKDRFFRGARRMGKLNHPNIVRVKEENCNDGGYHYFVMEYLSGGDFYENIKLGRLSLEERLSCVLEIADALTFSHSKKIIHRDVKPENILLDQHGKPKLTDFDLVWANDTPGGTRTKGLGTYIYSAPELQINAQKPQPACDVYSLGMVTLFAVINGPIDPMVQFERTEYINSLPIGSSMKKFLEKAISPRVENRFKTIAEFCQALKEAIKPSKDPVAKLNVITPQAPILQPAKPQEVSKAFNPKALPSLFDQERWCWIPPGTFIMGSNDRAGNEWPVHKVTIDPGFWLGKYPITNAEYDLFIEDDGYKNEEYWSQAGMAWKQENKIDGHQKEDGFTGPAQPVVNVSWYESEAFCRWLTQNLGIQPWAKGTLLANLPSEAQWEYAAKGRDDRKYAWGNQDPSHDRANYGRKIEKTTNVGSYPATEHGLLDMSGNVWEWCLDGWDSKAYGKRGNDVRNPLAPPGTDFVLRGGSWACDVWYLRLAFRFGFWAWNRSGDIGFRPCLVLVAVAEHV